jgi:F-type H+-transporting ATPase subunit a
MECPVSAHALVLAESCHFETEPSCGFPAPGPEFFVWEPIFTIPGIDFGVTKPMLLSLLSALLILGFFWAAFGNSKVIPSKLQLIGEAGYTFVRDGISRDIIGKKGDRFLPFLMGLFFFIWVMNTLAFIPLIQFPATSRIAFPAGLAAMVWLLYMGVGFRKHGFLGYLKVLCWPSGVPGWVMVLLVPIEFISNVFVRPFTLAIRLFANMFAGHMLVATFSVAAWYLLAPNYGALFAGVSFVLAIVFIAFELLIQFLQAYIFTALTSTYLAGALEEAH